MEAVIAEKEAMIEDSVNGNDCSDDVSDGYVGGSW